MRAAGGAVAVGTAPIRDCPCEENASAKARGHGDSAMRGSAMGGRGGVIGGGGMRGEDWAGGGVKRLSSAPASG